MESQALQRNLNILDGVTSTAAELNILDGVTSTATELNILDGVTATTAEINYVDGVTSNVQTQLNTKAPIAGATFTGTTTIPTADINGGAIDGTVIGGSTAAAGSFTTLGASGAITGTLGTAAQTNITSVGTLSALTVSGDLTVDTNSLKVDSSNNRVGILNASPDVTLDIGTATDAVHMPTGTTAQRPTGAAGYFRYNSTLEQFEGYTDAWGAIGGGGGSNLVSDTMTGDGSDTTLTLSNDPLNENNTQVYIDGVYQNKDTYSVSGTTLTFSTAPPNGSAVEAMTIQPTAVNVPADASVTSAKLSGALTTPAALTVTGALTGTSATFTTADNSDNLTLTSTDADANSGPNVKLYRNSSSPADNDFLGNIKFVGRNDNSQDVQYAEQEVYILDASDGTEDGLYNVNVMTAGANTSYMQFKAGSGVVFNEDSNDIDFRVESDNSTHALFVQGSDGNVSLNHASPTAILDVRRGDASGKIAEFHTSTGFGIELGSSQSEAYIQAGSSQALLFKTNGSNERMRIRSNGTISFATDGNYLTNKHYNFRDAVGIDNPSSSSYSVSTSSVLTVGAMSTGRSINATGTINASGADYAEYMYKADGCGAIAKGDVVGVDINGKLTDVFADSISFVIKSTNPSYVGGDTWADEEPPSKDTAEWDSWYERTETKRATVDRIAFSGQVPVNITGSFNVGDYIYPEVNGSGIKAVAKPSPTFDEYKLCVGKIWATEKNGKPYVAVKIG